MRKLKLQMQISMDGFVAAGPNDEQHWVTWAWEEIRPQVLELADSCDTVLIGRKLAVDYIPYWQEVFTRPEDTMHEVAQRIMAMQKVVFSKTLDRSVWENTTVANGELATEVDRLKQQPGKDLIVYGGTSFVSDLLKEDLVDEYYFFVNPVALGHGDPVFNGLSDFRQLTLKNSTRYNCGIVLMHYAPR
ncbi:dihydrofolate reductase family protein [Chitinophaga sp. 22536]|uniref:dihydrofolate reductase family protein n=1 Tax=unclassified Chitinophaga TaxID=2619133 RepID=UPI003F849DCB